MEKKASTSTPASGLVNSSATSSTKASGSVNSSASSSTSASGSTNSSAASSTSASGPVNSTASNSTSASGSTNSSAASSTSASGPVNSTASNSTSASALPSFAAYVRYIVLKNNKLEFFVLLSLLYLLSAIIVNEYIMRDELYYHSLGSQVSINVIDELIGFKNKWQWFSYAGIPVILAVKFLLIGTFLSMGSIVAGHRLTFRQIFALVMVAELVYLFASFITTGILLISDIQSLEDMNISLLSLAPLVPGAADKPYIYVPLQSISLFLLIYILLLTWCYNTVTGYPLRSSFSLILATYGTAIILWLILVMYLMISYA